MSTGALKIDRLSKKEALLKKEIKQSGAQPLKKLRVLSGVNKGVSVNLSDGVYELGSSDGCDLIITDEKVKEHHLFLEIRQGEMNVCPIKTLVYVNGKRCVSRQVIHFFDVVMVGGTRFCIGPRDETWPRIRAFNPKVVKAKDTAIVASVEPDKPVVSPKQILLEKQQEDAQKTKKLMFPIILFVCVLLAVFSLGILLPVHTAGAGSSTIEDSINRVIQRENLDRSLTLQTNEAGGLELSGYIADMGAFSRLKSTMLNKYPAVRMRVWTASDLVSRAKEILKSLGVHHVEVDLDGDKRLAVKGYVTEQRDWGRARYVLAQDVPDVMTIDDEQIYTLEQILDRMNKLIIEKGLDRWITLKPQTEVIVAKGVLPKDQFDQWLRVLSEFRQDIGFFVDVNDQVIDAKKQKINLPEKSVRIGEVSYLTLKNNSRYTVGSFISDGFVLQAINLDHVVLVKNNIKYDYYIGTGHGK
jgi:type III secretion system YscD/HrpQ family protein